VTPLNDVAQATPDPKYISPMQQHALGWDIFPMRADVKAVYTVKWGIDNGWTRLTADQVAATWPAPRVHNIGVATGHRSGVWVLDVDRWYETEEEAREYVREMTGVEIPQTLSVRTASGKWHFYFKMPDNQTVEVKTNRGKPDGTGGLAPYIDVRGDGGMAMGVGSTVINPDTGEICAYEVITMTAPVYAPLELLERVKKKDGERLVTVAASVEKNVDPKADETARSWINKEVQRLRDLQRPWESGAGWHDTCFEVSCNLNEFANSEWCSMTTEDALERYFEAAPGPEKDWNPAKEWEEGRKKVAGQGRELPRISSAADAAAESLMNAATPSKPARPRDEAVIGTDSERPRLARPRPVLTGTPADRLAHARQVYRKWLGPMYDLDALHVALAARAAHELDGEPVWVLTLSGSGNAKTEGLMPLGRTEAHTDDDSSFTKVRVVSEINGTPALLSGSPRKETAKDATGGLLEDLGMSGVIILKDFTTILSMHREKRAETLAALREVYDGTWVRQVGTDGGKALRWDGKVTLIGATTSAYDSHHSVISAMGDRFALLRVDSESRAVRMAATKQARLNTGSEAAMRQEMGEAVEAVIAGMDRAAADIDLETYEVLDLLADVVTNIRTTVEFDQRSRSAEVAHAPEVGTRFGKMLVQIVRAGLAVGMTPEEALALAQRVGRDSTPQIRVECLEALAKHGPQTTHGVSTLINKPKGTVDRGLQGLQLLGFISYRPGDPVFDGTRSGAWIWSLAEEWKDAPEILGAAS